MVTGDELAQELYRQQGYLLVSSKTKIKIGEIILQYNEVGIEPMTQPTRIVAEASIADFKKQQDLAKTICQYNFAWPYDPNYVYRVESD